MWPELPPPRVPLHGGKSHKSGEGELGTQAENTTDDLPDKEVASIGTAPGDGKSGGGSDAHQLVERGQPERDDPAARSTNHARTCKRQ